MIPPFYRLRSVPVTASTNADLQQAAEAGEPEGLVIRAMRQTAGRGRQGREWDSPEGNLYASILLRPACSLREVGCYSFIAALAVHDTIAAFLPPEGIQLKWPNDVLVKGGKISGILLESSPAAADGVAWLVIGIGVNVLHCPDQALYPTTSLALESRACGMQEMPSVDAVFARLLESFEARRQQFLRHGFAPIRQDWLARAKTGAITARLPHETVEGQFCGLDEQGALILRLADGRERAIAAGDIFFPR